jgi:hypothetical protein
MKFALIGAAAVAAAAFVTPALAQGVISNPACGPFYLNANCRNLASGNPDTAGGYYRDDNWRNALAIQTLNNTAYRYHGGPKYND